MDIRYTAGIFDGEGGVRISKSKQTRSVNSHYSLIVYLQMTDEIIPINLKSDWGGSINLYKKPKTNWKNQYVWKVCSNNAIDFLKAIQPFTLIKGQRIKVAIEFQGLLHSPIVYNKKLIPSELDKREKCFQQMKLLNKRGK